MEGSVWPKVASGNGNGERLSTRTLVIFSSSLSLSRSTQLILSSNGFSQLHTALHLLVPGWVTEKSYLYWLLMRVDEFLADFFWWTNLCQLLQLWFSDLGSQIWGWPHASWDIPLHLRDSGLSATSHRPAFFTSPTSLDVLSSINPCL